MGGWSKAQFRPKCLTLHCIVVDFLCLCFFRDMPISLIRLILFPSSGALSIKDCEVRIIITEALDRTSCYIFIISFILNPYAAGGYIGQYKMMLKT